MSGAPKFLPTQVEPQRPRPPLALESHGASRLGEESAFYRRLLPIVRPGVSDDGLTGASVRRAEQHLSPTSTVARDFAPYFHSRVASPERDEGMLQSIFELRYQVYCLECGFLPAEQYPQRRESDDHDERSSHFCAFNHREELVGYVRLVAPDTAGRFPFQEHCHRLLDDVCLPPASQSAEISRLMVRSDYRRRQGDLLSGVTAEQNDAAFGGSDRRSDSPQILLSLYRQMYHYSLDNGIRYWYAAMERALARSLKRLSFAFQQIGPETDYFGPVAPYVADLRELERRVGESNPALMAWLRSRDIVAA